MAIGILASRKTKSSDSFVGAGMGMFAIVCVDCGQLLSGTAIMGCSEYGATSGISGWWYTIANGVGMMMGLFFAEHYRRYGEVTVPGIIKKVVGPKSRTVCSCLLIFVMIAVGLSQMIAAGRYPLSIGSFAISETYLGVVLACVTIAVFSKLFPQTELEKVRRRTKW